MALLTVITIFVALGFAHVIWTEIAWHRRLAQMAREVRERGNEQA